MPLLINVSKILFVVYISSNYLREITSWASFLKLHMLITTLIFQVNNTDYLWYSTNFYYFLKLDDGAVVIELLTVTNIHSITKSEQPKQNRCFLDPFYNKKLLFYTS